MEVEDESRYSVIPPGVNLTLFDRSQRNSKEATTAQKVELALARDLAADRTPLPCILASARLEPKKNHVGLVQAYLRSSELLEKANLVLAVRGLEGSLREATVAKLDLPTEAKEILSEIKGLAEEHGLWSKIATVSLEGQDELAAAYRHLAYRRSVFCLPAHHEPFGLAPLEAMAAGLPVVSTRFGGPSESMIDSAGEYGVLVDPGDPANLAAGLLRLITDPGEWRKLREAGHQRVLDRYTWQRTAERYAALGAQLAKEPGQRQGIAIHPYWTSGAEAPLLEAILTR